MIFNVQIASVCSCVFSNVQVSIYTVIGRKLYSYTTQGKMPPMVVSMDKRSHSKSVLMGHSVFPIIKSESTFEKEDWKCSSNNKNNRIHPVTSITQSAAELKNIRTARASGAVNVTDSNSYVVKVRVLHGIDLHIPTSRSCQHTLRPEVRIKVNGGPLLSCIAAQHARNHSIWKDHDLKFCVIPQCQDSRQSRLNGTVNTTSSFISMYVSLVCSLCPCTAKSQYGVPKQVSIGEVGELQFPTKQNESYEITRFFSVIRYQQRKKCQSSDVLLLAGKIKLRICVEAEKLIVGSSVVQPRIDRLAPLTKSLPTNFEEALKRKQKQLKSIVLPMDNSKVSSNQHVVRMNTNDSFQLIWKITIETLSDHISAKDLRVEEKIGEGVHAQVSRGLLHCESDGGSVRVAVKEFRHQHKVPPINVLRAFQQEYRILDYCRSQNGCGYIVEMLGVMVEPRLALITEYLGLGSLAQCLLNEDVWSQMTILQKATLGLKIAKGIAWLHKHNVIHRDIKPHNILLSGSLMESNLVVKVGDLGSAVIRHPHEPLLTDETGSSGYTAPEIFTRLGYDNKIDVWSFGVVLWELMSASLQDRANCFTGLTGEEFVRKVQGGCRPIFSYAHQVSTRVIVEKCWLLDPSQRPNMNEVVKELETLCTEL
ncbi:putative serine/threonine-protein kinase YKL116C, predicted [Plasmopara halstedii]